MYNNAPVGNRRLAEVVLSENSVRILGKQVWAKDLGIEESSAQPAEQFSAEDLTRIQAMLCRCALTDMRRRKEGYAERQRHRDRAQIDQAINTLKNGPNEKKAVSPKKKHRKAGKAPRATTPAILPVASSS
jgi:hypothetical protein